MAKGFGCSGSWLNCARQNRSAMYSCSSNTRPSLLWDATPRLPTCLLRPKCWQLVESRSSSAIGAGTFTFHGPGQLVGYPILDLRGYGSSQLSAISSQSHPSRKTLGVVDYVRRLEEVLIRSCADFGIPTKRVAGLTGVWTMPQATMLT